MGKKQFQVSGFKFLVRNLKLETWNLKLNAVNLSIVVLALLSLAGCLPSAQPDRTQFYALTARAEAGAAAAIPGEITLGVGPVRIPGYLDREEIVTRIGANRFEVAQNDRWIEPLEENLGRVLAQNLYILLKSERIVRYPWPASRRVTHQVEVEILRCETDAAREAELSARWSLIDVGTKQVLAGKTGFFKRPAKPGGREAAVEALSETLADLSREIAGAIQTIARERKP